MANPVDPIPVLYPYNGTGRDGGDSSMSIRIDNLEIPEIRANIAFLLQALTYVYHFSARRY